MNVFSSLVLTFHKLYKEKQLTKLSNDFFIEEYSVSEVKFNEFLNYLSPKNCITVSELLTNMSNDTICITFDDGLISDYEIAIPILKKYKLRATFFVTVNNIGRDGYCTDAQLRKMSDLGMEIGSHGMNHDYLTGMRQGEVFAELRDSKILLEKILSKQIFAFAPVGGHYENWMIKAAIQYNYKIFATMIPGVSKKFDEFIILHRNHIKKNHSEYYFQKLINHKWSTHHLNKFKYYILLIPKKIFGLNGYNKIKKIYRIITKYI